MVDSLGEPGQRGSPTSTKSPAPFGFNLLLDAGLTLALCAVLAVVYLIDGGGIGGPPKSYLGAFPLPPPPPPPPPDLDVESFLPPIDPVPRIALEFASDGRFGLVTTTGNPDDPTDDQKRLTFSEHGGTNNLRIWVDDDTPEYGRAAGTTREKMERRGPNRYSGVWEYRGVRVEQFVELTAGEVSRRTDTVRVRYTLENTDSQVHEVGLRFLLDTLIGDNDGVQFIVPGREGCVRQPQSFKGEEVPAWVRAIERGADLKNPGVVVNIGELRTTDGESPSEVVLSHWPGADAQWDYDRKTPFGNDSSVGLYYARKPLAPRQKRVIQFTYGLGKVTSDGRFGITAGSAPKAGSEFYLVALVQPPRPGQTVKVQLPPQLELKDPSRETQAVLPGNEYSKVDWLVRAAPDYLGKLDVTARLEPEGIDASTSLTVGPRDSRLILKPQLAASGGRGFWVTALIQDAKEGQSIELKLDGVAGVSLHPDHPARRPVPVTPASEQHSQVAWWLVVESRVEGKLTLTATVTPGELRESASVTLERGNLIR